MTEQKKRQPSRPLRALEAAIRIGQAEYLGRKFRPHSVWAQDYRWLFAGTEVPLRPWEHRALIRKVGDAARRAVQRADRFPIRAYNDG